MHQRKSQKNIGKHKRHTKLTSLLPQQRLGAIPPPFSSKNSLISIPIPMRHKGGQCAGGLFQLLPIFRLFFGGFVRKEEAASPLTSSPPLPPPLLPYFFSAEN
jgi:hypothetical protein